VSHTTIERDLKEFAHDVQTHTRTSKRGRGAATDVKNRSIWFDNNFD